MTTSSSQNEMISVVIPIFNEAPIIPELHRRLTDVLQKCALYEIVFVNDGSSDGSLRELVNLCQGDQHCKIIDFSRNFGHQCAITAGLHNAVGDAVIIMDGDLQDPPELISELLAKWREGFEIVFAQRTARQGERIYKRLTAKVFYRLIKQFSDVPIPLDAGDFRLLDRKVVNELNRMGENARFLRGMISWLGFRQTAIAYNRDMRFSGKTKYSLKKMFRLAFDGMTSFSSFPLSIATYLGFLVASFSGLYAIVVLIKRMLGHTVPGWTSLMLVILFLGSVQLVCVGILGQYISRIFNETKHRPLYVIHKKYGFDIKASSVVVGAQIPYDENGESANVSGEIKKAGAIAPAFGRRKED
jgi:dolichol-phosphate mannosyltransferase